MNDNLDTLSDAALSECFAVEVAGALEAKDGAVRMKDQALGGTVFESWVKCPPFATNVNTVLPWLEKCGDVDATMTRHAGKIGYVITINREDNRSTAPTFARAACIALIRAKRAAK